MTLNNPWFVDKVKDNVEKEETKTNPVISQIVGTVCVSPSFGGIQMPDGTIVSVPESSAVGKDNPPKETVCDICKGSRVVKSKEHDHLLVWCECQKAEPMKKQHPVCSTCQGSKTQNTAAYGLIPCRFCNEQTVEELQDRYAILKRKIPNDLGELNRILERIMECQKEYPTTDNFSGFAFPCKKEEVDDDEANDTPPMDSSDEYEDEEMDEEGDVDDIEEEEEENNVHDEESVDREDDKYYLNVKDEESDKLEIVTPKSQDEPKLLVWVGCDGILNGIKGTFLNVERAKQVSEVLSRFIRDNTKEDYNPETYKRLEIIDGDGDNLKIDHCGDGVIVWVGNAEQIGNGVIIKKEDAIKVVDDLSSYFGLGKDEEGTKEMSVVDAVVHQEFDKKMKDINNKLKEIYSKESPLGSAYISPPGAKITPITTAPGEQPYCFGCPSPSQYYQRLMDETIKTNELLTKILDTAVKKTNQDLYKDNQIQSAIHQQTLEQAKSTGLLNNILNRIIMAQTKVDETPGERVLGALLPDKPTAYSPLTFAPSSGDKVVFVELGEGYEDPSEEAIKKIQDRVFKLCGYKAVLMPPGTKMSFPPCR